MLIDGRRAKMPPQGVITRAKPAPNGDPPVWTVTLSIDKVGPSYTAIVSIHADSPLEAIGVLATWTSEDFEGGPQFTNEEERAVDLLKTDGLIVESIELER